MIRFHPKTCLVCQLVVRFNFLDIPFHSPAGIGIPPSTRLGLTITSTPHASMSFILFAGSQTRFARRSGLPPACSHLVISRCPVDLAPTFSLPPFPSSYNLTMVSRTSSELSLLSQPAFTSTSLIFSLPTHDFNCFLDLYHILIIAQLLNHH